MNFNHETERVNTTNLLLRVARCSAFLGIGAWGWYVSALFRTTGWGYANPAEEMAWEVLTLGCFAVPLAFLPLIGVPWRSKFLAIGALTIGCTLAVEAFARSQEYLLVRKLGRQPTKDHIERRWWPFEYHDLGFSQGKWWGCD